MSARARRRLINSALNEHPVAQETLRTYDAVLLFSRNMVQWLDGEGLSEEANLVKSVKPVILNKVNFIQVLLIFPSQQVDLLNQNSSEQSAKVEPSIIHVIPYMEEFHLW